MTRVRSTAASVPALLVRPVKPMMILVFPICVSRNDKLRGLRARRNRSLLSSLRRFFSRDSSILRALGDAILLVSLIEGKKEEREKEKETFRMISHDL